MDESALRQKLERFFEYAGADVDRAEELYHEDAVWSFRRAVSASRGATRSPSGAASTQSSEPTCTTGSAG
jgi:hypothetical protein